MKNGSRRRPESTRRAFELVRFVIQTLVDDSSDFRIEIQEVDQGSRFVVHCAEPVRERYLNENNRTLQSIRILLESLGAREGRRFELEVEESAS